MLAGDIFTWDPGGKFSSRIEDACLRFSRAADSSVIEDFWDSAAEYLRDADPEHPDADCGRTCDIAEACRDLYTGCNITALDAYVDGRFELPRGQNLLADKFVVYIVRMWIKRVKEKESLERLGTELVRIFGVSPCRAQFFYDVYCDMPSSVVGGVTRREDDYFWSIHDLTEDHQAELLPVFLRTNYERVCEAAGKLLDSMRSSPQVRDHLWYKLAEHSFLIALSDQLPLEVNPIRWLMQRLIEDGVSGHMLAVHDVMSLAEHGKYQMTQREFVKFIEKRIELEKLPERPYPEFEVMPYNFNVKHWVSAEVDSEAISGLCRMTIESRTFTSGYRLPEYLSDLDVSAEHIAKFVSCYLDAHKDADRLLLYELACLASSFDDSSESWRRIAEPICRRLDQSSLGLDDIHSVYQGFLPKMQVWSGVAGEVPQHFVDRVSSTRKVFESEQLGSPLAGYRAWAYNRAVWEVKSEEERVEGERHE